MFRHKFKLTICLSLERLVFLRALLEVDVADFLECTLFLTLSHFLPFFLDVPFVLSLIKRRQKKKERNPARPDCVTGLANGKKTNKKTLGKSGAEFSYLNALLFWNQYTNVTLSRSLFEMTRLVTAMQEKKKKKLKLSKIPARLFQVRSNAKIQLPPGFSF